MNMQTAATLPQPSLSPSSLLPPTTPATVCHLRQVAHTERQMYEWKEFFTLTHQTSLRDTTSVFHKTWASFMRLFWFLVNRGTKIYDDASYVGSHTSRCDVVYISEKCAPIFPNGKQSPLTKARTTSEKVYTSIPTPYTRRAFNWINWIGIRMKKTDAEIKLSLGMNGHFLCHSSHDCYFGISIYFILSIYAL